MDKVGLTNSIYKAKNRKPRNHVNFKSLKCGSKNMWFYCILHIKCDLVFWTFSNITLQSRKSLDSILKHVGHGITSSSHYVYLWQQSIFHHWGILMITVIGSLILVAGRLTKQTFLTNIIQLPVTDYLFNPPFKGM